MATNRIGKCMCYINIANSSFSLTQHLIVKSMTEMMTTVDRVKYRELSRFKLNIHGGWEGVGGVNQK